MSEQTQISLIRLSILALTCSAILFVVYPALRPFSDEVSLQGAAAFASVQWIVSHIMGIVAFTLLPIGLLGLLVSLRGTGASRMLWATVICIAGIGLTLPFYGGETYGLYAIGQEALIQNTDAIMGMAEVVRSGAGLVLFLIGLLLVGIAAVIAAISIWKSIPSMKWGGIPFAIGMGLYIPQFMADQTLRVAHGLLVAVGCLGLVFILWKAYKQKVGQGTLN